MSKMTLKINNPALASIYGLKAGDTIDVETREGVPIAREWRNRLRDSELDGCVSVQNAEKPAKKPEKPVGGK